MRFCFFLTALVLLTACGRFAPGFIVMDDGRTVANSDENNRQLVIGSIRTQLDAQLGGHWRTDVTLPELPVYESTEARSDYPGGWRWTKATASVVVVGDGSAPLPMTTDAMRQAVVDYLSPKVERPSRNLSVTVTSVTDAVRFAALSSATTTPAAASTTSANSSAGPRRYTVQAGDTLADISVVFYGSAQHWRLIRDANAGVDAGELKPGTVLVIPPKP